MPVNTNFDSEICNKLFSKSITLTK